MKLRGMEKFDDSFFSKLKSDLNSIYSSIPDTKGCMENIAKPKEDGGCASWCCRVQNPQVLYSEFINTWNTISSEWDNEELIGIISYAIRNFLNNNVAKGCIFHDGESGLCRQHETRPLACRCYGITPDDEFKPRYERLRVIYPKADIRPQCGLVSTTDGTILTKKDTDQYWDDLINVEIGIGVPKHQITDEPGGTYRTYHDHIMVSMYPKEILIELTKMRLHATEEEKTRFINTVVSFLKEKKSGEEKRKDQ